MGRWDYHAVEIREGETPQQAMRALREAQAQVHGLDIDHGFLGYWFFSHEDRRYIHVGWNSCNRMAHKVLQHLGKNRQVFSSYSDHTAYGFIFFANIEEEFDPPLSFQALG